MIVSAGHCLATSCQGSTLSALSPAKVWVGLANSDDVGIRFDLQAIVSVDGSQVGSVSGQRGGRIEQLQQREDELAVISQDVVPERSGLV